MRIVVIEDEPAIADFLVRGLRDDGHDVTCVGTAAEGRQHALDADLVILDLMLPDGDGLDVLRAIRSVDPVLPVILLTARAEIEDRVAGLDLGATDYVTKPFSFAELAARVRAHLRAPRAGEPTELEAAGIHLDLLSREARRDGEAVRLSTTEFELLAHFLRHPDEVLGRERILAAVWGYDHDPGTNIVEVYVSYLRRKLGRPGSPAPIETVRSVGYRLRTR